MFPDAQSDTFPLERCMRILPHHDDTGGFFVAVFEKVARYLEAGGVKRPRQEDADVTAPSAADIAATDAAVDAASEADQASMAAVAAAKAASDRADVMLQSVSSLKTVLAAYCTHKWLAGQGSTHAQTHLCSSKSGVCSHTPALPLDSGKDTLCLVSWQIMHHHRKNCAQSSCMVVSANLLIQASV